MAFPVKSSVGLPWCIHAADVTAWEAADPLGTSFTDWTVIPTRADTQRRHELDKPLLGYSVNKEWSWLTNEWVEVTRDVLHYIKRNTWS